MLIGPPDGRQESKYSGVGDGGRAGIDESIEIDEWSEIENVDELELEWNIRTSIATPAI